MYLKSMLHGFLMTFSLMGKNKGRVGKATQHITLKLKTFDKLKITYY